LSLADSTGLSDGSNTGVTASSGKIDGASEYNGSNQHWQNIWQGSTGNSPWSVSFWINTDTVSSAKTWTRTGSLATRRVLSIGHTNTGKLKVNHYYDDWTTTLQLSINTWHHIVVTYDGSRGVSVYKDGAWVQSRTLSADLNIGGDTALYVGRWASGVEQFDGELDEYRIHTNQLSADWIATEYNNQNSPSTFYDIEDISPSSFNASPLMTNILKLGGFF
jgi:hypothetical protein